MKTRESRRVTSLARPVRVSVLLVNYKAYDELTVCLRSIEPFRGPDIEVRLVDHESDQARAALLSTEFPWLTLLPSPDNPGFATGVNRAAKEARGQYLLLLNPDCVLAQDAIRPLATWMDSHARVGAAGARIRDADGSLQASARRFPTASTAFGGRTTWLTRLWPNNPLTHRNLVGLDAAAPMEVDWVSGACTLIRRAAFDEVGGLDEGFFLYWEDADLCLRLKKRGWTTIYHPGVEVTHFTGRSSAHARRRSLVAFHRSAFRYFWKHAGPVGRLVSPFVLVGLQIRLLLKMARLQAARMTRRDGQALA